MSMSLSLEKKLMQLLLHNKRNLHSEIHSQLKLLVILREAMFASAIKLESQLS